MQKFEPELSLVVGAPRHPLGQPLVERLASEGRPVAVLMEPGEIRARRERLSSRLGPRVQPLFGGASSIDLGLSGAEYLSLRAAVKEIHLLLPPAARARGGGDPVRAVREATLLAEGAPRVERLTFWSSVFACGRRTGALREEPSPHAPAEGEGRSLRRADALAAEAVARLPATLLRTGTIVLEPRVDASGEALGAARLLVLFLLSRRGDAWRVMPGRADGALSFVPAEYAVNAGLTLSRHPRGARGIFHVIDSDPPTVRRAITILCELSGREPPRAFAPPFAASALLRAPFLSPDVEELRDLLDELGSSLDVSDARARSILEPLGIVCPAFESYAESLVDDVRGRMHDARRLAGSLERRLS